jgi:hypothetical protein
VTSNSGTGAPASPTVPALNGEIPFFQNVEDCPVYGVYHPARANSTGLAVVFAPGLGVEQLTGYRNEVLLARELSARGIASLRFHPRGQGDSGGDAAELTLATFSLDVVAMSAELLRRSGATRLVGLGTRLGALALGRAIADGQRFAGLALWEPVQRPADYFRGLMRGVLFSQVAHADRQRRTMEDMLASLDRDGSVDVLGYYLYRALMDGARDDLVTLLSGWTGPALLVQVDARRSLAPAHAALVESLRSRGAPVEVRDVREDVAWPFLQNPAWESPELVRFTADWIHALA